MRDNTADFGGSDILPTDWHGADDGKHALRSMTMLIGAISIVYNLNGFDERLILDRQPHTSMHVCTHARVRTRAGMHVVD